MTGVRTFIISRGLTRILTMAETYSLAAETREITKKSARDTRSLGRIPGVLYGHGVDSQPFSVDYSEFLRLIRRAGQSSLVDLDLGGKKTKVLIHKYDQDPVRDTFTHIDLMAVNLKEKTIVHVPLEFVGESDAVKNKGGVLNIAHNAIDIRCLPADIPHEITIDISKLKEIHDHVSIADLNLGDKFEVMHLDADTQLCSIMGRAAEEDLDAPVEAPEADLAPKADAPAAE